FNLAGDFLSSITGGCDNVAGTGTPLQPSSANPCTSANESITGGEFNTATRAFSSINGGCDNLAGSTGAPQPRGRLSGGQADAARITKPSAGPPKRCQPARLGLERHRSGSALDVCQSRHSRARRPSPSTLGRAT